MSEPAGGRSGARRPDRPPALTPPRYGRVVAVIAAIALGAFTIHTALGKSSGATGIAVGQAIPPFAAPLAIGGPAGDVDVATHDDDGQAGKIAACHERGAGILNICEQYERGPVVLALFVDSGSCPDVLSDMQTLSSSFPQVAFAAVALEGQAGSVAKLVRKRALSFPVGIDRDGILAGLYKVSTCPQLTFVDPGGTVQSRAVYQRVPLPRLRARVAQLLSSARARGWRPSHA